MAPAAVPSTLAALVHAMPCRYRCQKCARAFGTRYSRRLRRLALAVSVVSHVAGTVSASSCRPRTHGEFWRVRKILDVLVAPPPSRRCAGERVGGLAPLDVARTALPHLDGGGRRPAGRVRRRRARSGARSARCTSCTSCRRRTRSRRRRAACSSSSRGTRSTSRRSPSLVEAVDGVLGVLGVSRRRPRRQRRLWRR